MTSDLGGPSNREPRATSGERDAMKQAIALAVDPSFRTGPNPRVGCVLLDEAGRIVGRGAHQGPGTPHAEVAALSGLPSGAAPHTAVVTLEPCNHHGTTGPCVDALLEAGVRRVIFGLRDPNPVAGGGQERLRAAGVEVVGGVCSDECAEVDPGWITAIGLGRPHVTWKSAVTLDGRVAAPDGSSRWISSTASRHHAHVLRGANDCVMVGTGTVIADNPSLTVRGVSAPQPLRVVMGHRDVPEGAALNEGNPVLHLRTHDPREALDELWRSGVRRILLEGGPTLAGAFAQAGAIDRVVVYLAPKLLGQGFASLDRPGVQRLSDALDLDIVETMRLGDDVVVDATVRGAR